MRIVLLGPPGAGKGSLAALIKDMGIAHISSGDMLREEMKKGSKLGLEIKGLIANGALVSDELITKLVEHKMTQDPELSEGFALDGFPRTTQQAQDLDSILSRLNKPLDFVLCMDAQVETILKRLTGRRVCRQCGALFHLTNKPPKKMDVCDLCNGELYQRSDDNEETIRKRLEIYETSTKPIIDYYAAQGKLKRINANRETVDAHSELIKIINEDKPNQNQKYSRN